MASFVALRLLLILATSYLLLAQADSFSLPPSLATLIVLALGSNLLFLWIPEPWQGSTLLVAGILVADTAWITIALWMSGHFRPEFFYVYFFLLLVAGIGENLRLIVLGAVLIGAAYLYLSFLTSDGSPIWSQGNLIRIPFLLAVASFYGHLVDRVRQEERRAENESLAHTRVAAANRQLEREIAEREQAEAQIRKLSRAVEQSAVMVIITDHRGRVEYVNPRFSTATGYSEEEILGRNLRELELLPAPADGEEDPWTILASGRDWRGELLQRKRSGETYWVTTTVSPIHDPSGELLHLVAVQEDMTHVKHAEEVLKKANADLKQINRMKSDFISTVSHELRTPMAAMKNALDILAASDMELDAEEERRFLDIAQRNVLRLTELINDILDLSRIEAGRLEYRFGELSVPSLVQDVALSLEAQAESRGLSLEVRVEDDLPEVWGDASRLQQVLTNLVGNALKFTEAGGRIEIAARRVGEQVEVSVEDTGIGLSAEDRERIFERFYQVDDPMTRTVKGSGLGLSISREMLLAHGSDLEVESQLHVGSRFFFRLHAFSPATLEMSELEKRFTEHRTYPFFGVLVIRLEGEGSVEEVARRLASHLPRSSDELTAQPIHRRVVTVLKGTDRGGTDVVFRKLTRELQEGGSEEEGPRIPALRVLPPGSFPEDGTTAWQIIGQIEKREGDTGP